MAASMEENDGRVQTILRSKNSAPVRQAVFLVMTMMMMTTTLMTTTLMTTGNFLFYEAGGRRARMCDSDAALGLRRNFRGLNRFQSVFSVLSSRP